MSGGREVSLLEVRFMSEGRKGTRNNEEGVGRGNEARFLRLVKVV